MRYRPTRIKHSSAEFDLSQGPLVFGHELRKRFSGSDGNAPIWLPQTSREFIRANQAATIEDNRGMDPGLLAAMLDRDTVEMLGRNSPLVQRPTTVAEQRGKGLTAGTVLGSALQFAAKKDASKRTRVLLGLAGLGVGLGLSSGPRHPLGRSAVVDWETDPEKPDVVEIPRQVSLNRALGDAIVGGIGGGTVAMLSGAKRPMINAGIGIGAAGLAALNQALAARGDRIYSGRSKQSSATNMDEYLKSREDYLTLRKKQHRNTAGLGLLGAVPGVALSGLGAHTMMKNLAFNPSWSKQALGLVGVLAGGALAALPSKLMQRADVRRRQEAGVDPGFVAPEITAHRALADAAAGVGLGSGLAMTMNRPALAAAAAGVAGLTGILAVSRAMKRDREQADFAASNDHGAYAAGRGLTEGNRFVRSLSPGMMYVSPVAPGERVLGSG